MLNRTLRLLLVTAILALTLLAILVLTLSMGSLLEFWQQLLELPSWIMGLYLFLMLLIIGLAGGALWWLFKPTVLTTVKAIPREEPDESSLDARIGKARSQGIDTGKIEYELKKLQQRRDAGEIHVAVFGEISSGKSSLIRALVPGAEALTGVTGGTTRELAEYRWTSPAGDALVLVDMPGLNEADGTLDALSIEEAQRSHVVRRLPA